MRDYPFFYAPVNMSLLQEFADKIDIKENSGPYEKYFDLPVPDKRYSLYMHINNRLENKDVGSLLLAAALNPKRIFHTNDPKVLYATDICRLQGRDGYWSMMTHCSKCFRHPTHRFQCDAPNCANNIKFRRKFIHDD